MSMDFFPAKIIDGEMTQAISFKQMEERIFANFHDEEGTINPDYIPGSSVNMANGNAHYLLNRMGMDKDEVGQQAYAWPLPEFVSAFEGAVTNSPELSHYKKRFEALFKVCKDVDATHIMCV